MKVSILATSFCKRSIDIVPNETGGSLHDRLAQIAPEALLEALGLLAKGSAPRTPQDTSLATYAPKLKREDGRIDWIGIQPMRSNEKSAPSIRGRARLSTIGRIGQLRNLKIFSATIVALRRAHRAKFCDAKTNCRRSGRWRVVARRSAAGGKTPDERGRISAGHRGRHLSSADCEMAEH